MKKEKLKQFRLDTGITQEQMAKIICKDVSAYCRKENGQIKLTIEEWLKISKFFKINLDSIYESELKIDILNFINKEDIQDNLNVSISSEYIKRLMTENEYLKKKIKEYSLK
ncbi:helix-turn-helix domain-containing protein [Chryseobacterium sp. LC2016-27]|uniref:helix-turn-helix transcriptional regulator n=1 Tax=Chryseobacterium sp. LC2016-27 TaxID=2897326 RepID=UPI001E322CFD|nr:helix-turn-helix transcriptional regulator [Chryseobacterium sp. LC2016-27]MCD0456257.1 helix-turn-helix domain-containing protein [Chryseobacterium sp. LC2016-27]